MGAACRGMYVLPGFRAAGSRSAAGDLLAGGSRAGEYLEKWAALNHPGSRSTPANNHGDGGAWGSQHRGGRSRNRMIPPHGKRSLGKCSCRSRCLGFRSTAATPWGSIDTTRGAPHCRNPENVDPPRVGGQADREVLGTSPLLWACGWLAHRSLPRWFLSKAPWSLVNRWSIPVLSKCFMDHELDQSMLAVVFVKSYYNRLGLPSSFCLKLVMLLASRQE